MIVFILGVSILTNGMAKIKGNSNADVMCQQSFTCSVSDESTEQIPLLFATVVALCMTDQNCKISSFHDILEY